MVSIIAANRNNSRGMSGVAPGASLYVARTHNMSTIDSIGETANAIRWCISRGCSVINISCGRDYSSPELKSACEFAQNRDVIICAAAPNKEVSVEYVLDYPISWNFQLVVPVSAVNREGLHYAPSGYSTRMLGAPGRIITAAYGTNQYCYLTGTSPATAIVTGMLALLKKKYPLQPAKGLIALLYAGTVNNNPNQSLPCGAVNLFNSFNQASVEPKVIRYGGGLVIQGIHNVKYIVEQKPNNSNTWSFVANAYSDETVPLPVSGALSPTSGAMSPISGAVPPPSGALMTYRARILGNSQPVQRQQNYYSTTQLIS
jgi:subtilisin family serine protease